MKRGKYNLCRSRNRPNIMLKKDNTNNTAEILRTTIKITVAETIQAIITTMVGTILHQTTTTTIIVHPITFQNNSLENNFRR